MPLEGHYERQTTPLYKLSRREMWVAASIVVVTLASLVGIVAFTGASNSNAATAKGCIDTTVAGIVGAETISACGQDAADVCAHAAEYEGARAETIVANCEEQAIKF